MGEFDRLDLGDARLDRRAKQIVSEFQRDPAASIPVAMKTIASREATYRFLRNVRVRLQVLLASHIAHTAARVAEDSSVPLIAIDKVTSMFEGEGDREGLVRRSKNKQSFDTFVALAVAADRRVHGVLVAHPLEGTGGSSADQWVGITDEAERALGETQRKPIYLMDREADALPLFRALQEKGRDFVIRVANRKVGDPEHAELLRPLREIAADASLTIKREVQLSRRPDGNRATRAKKRHPARSTRPATLVARACVIAFPKTTKHQLLSLNAIHVFEQDAPEGVVPVEWFLFTSLPINDASAVARAIDAYRRRWLVEEFFKALKSGCNFESLQLESLHTLTNALGLLIPIAWQLLALRTLAESDPKAPASHVLDDVEIRVLRRLSRDIKLGPTPSVEDAMLAIARLGGHFPQNGRPGWQTLFEGLKYVLDHAAGYRLALSEM